MKSVKQFRTHVTKLFHFSDSKDSSGNQLVLKIGSVYIPRQKRPKNKDFSCFKEHATFRRTFVLKADNEGVTHEEIGTGSVVIRGTDAVNISSVC